MYRDKWLVTVYSVVFVIVATANLVMFVYLLVAMVIEVCAHVSCTSTKPLHSLVVHGTYPQTYLMAGSLSLSLSLSLSPSLAHIPSPTEKLLLLS